MRGTSRVLPAAAAGWGWVMPRGRCVDGPCAAGLVQFPEQRDNMSNPPSRLCMFWLYKASRVVGVGGVASFPRPSHRHPTPPRAADWWKNSSTCSIVQDGYAVPPWSAVCCTFTHRKTGHLVICIEKAALCPAVRAVVPRTRPGPVPFLRPSCPLSLPLANERHVFDAISTTVPLR